MFITKKFYSEKQLSDFYLFLAKPALNPKQPYYIQCSKKVHILVLFLKTPANTFQVLFQVQIR